VTNVALADVVVVGGGLVGTSIAYELACAGAQVSLVDSADPGRASGAGAGIVSPQTFREPDEPWVELGVNAARHLATLVTRLADDGCDPGAHAFARCGSLVVALAEHEDRWFTEAADTILGRDHGVREIPTDDARSMFPPLGRVWRVLHNPEAARVDGRSLTASLRGAATARGVVVIDDHATGLTRSGDRVTELRLGDDVVGCGALVLATGAWSATWGATLGAALPVRPTKGQIVHVTSPDDTDSGTWPIIQPILNFYLVPWPAGRVACGGTFEADAGFDIRPTAAGVRDLLRECVTIAPGLGAATFTEVRVGLRPMSADDRPILGPLPGWANVHVCTGHGAEGLLMGAYTGALVASGVRGEPSPEIAPYGAGRFSPG
jgi:D-amino-acid dehydrogenase